MTTFTETFTGAAGALSTGYAALYSGAISRDGAGEGTGTGSAETGVLRTNETYGNDQKVTWTKRSVSGAVDGGIVRGSGSGSTWDGYRGYVYSVDQWEIERVTGGTGTTVASGSTGVTHAVGNTFEFSVSGTVLTLKRNGSELGSYDTNPDTTKYSSGSPGFYMYSEPLVDDVIFDDGVVGGPFEVDADPVALTGTLSISGDLVIEKHVPVEQSGAVAMAGVLGIAADVEIHRHRWRVPTNATEGTNVHVVVFAGSNPTYTIHAQGNVTVDASGNAELPGEGDTLGTERFALVHNYDDDTGTTSIYGGPCIATLVDVT